MAEYYCDFRNCNTVEDLKIRLNKFFDWFFENLDSLNIKSITTEMTNVHSKNGETTIQGPMLVMKDSDGVTRLELGLNSSTGDFLFTLYNALGAANIQLDSTANGDGIITGGTVRTAATGERVELSGNQLKTYNADNQLNGLVTNAASGQHYGDCSFFEGGVETLRIQSSGTGQGWSFMSENGATTIYVNPVFSGTTQHLADSTIGFFGADPVGQQTASRLSYQTVYGGMDTIDLSSINSALNNIVNKINGIMDKLDNLGLFNVS